MSDYWKFNNYHTKFWRELDGINFAYCDPDVKATLHRKAMNYMRKLADQLGIPKGSFDVRSNKGGIAVSGEITLHSDELYVQLSQSMFKANRLQFLIRGCKGRKDYSGLHNMFVDLTREGLSDVLKTCETAIEESRRAATP